MNEFTVIFLLILILNITVRFILGWRQISYVRLHRPQVPEVFADKIPPEAHKKAADYTQAKVVVACFETLFAMVILLGWTLGGGLQWLDNIWHSFGLSSQILLGTGLLLSYLAVVALLELPIAAYRVFGLERKFGFNRYTFNLFVTDLVKKLLLNLFIGTPLILLLLWIMHSADLWWLYLWLVWFGFSLLMTWAYPAFIAPLFNKFEPLATGELHRCVENLLKKNGFASKGIFVMDGSARSSHGNAYFAGLGTNKRIVFFDTLVDQLSTKEIEAVLAHELGHFKCNHTKKRMVIIGAISLAGAVLLGWLAEQAWFYQGLGIVLPSEHLALTLFIMIAPVFAFFLQPGFSWFSRKHEFEADDFASRQTHPKYLIQALVNLYKENANTLTPDPIYSAFYDSHPPALIRVAHLNKAIPST